MLGATSGNEAAGLAYLCGGYVFALYVFLVLTLLAMQFLRLEKGVPRALCRTAALALPLGMTVVGAIQASDLTVTDAVVQLPKLAVPVKAMLVTDVHLGHHRGRDYLAALVEQVNRCRPDVVLIAGH